MFSSQMEIIHFFSSENVFKILPKRSESYSRIFLRAWNLVWLLQIKKAAILKNCMGLKSLPKIENFTLPRFRRFLFLISEIISLFRIFFCRFAQYFLYGSELLSGLLGRFLKTLSEEKKWIISIWELNMFKIV